jgi:hypothetical protein
MSTGTNEDGIGFETRPSGECDVPYETPNVVLWIVGIGAIAVLIMA